MSMFGASQFDASQMQMESDVAYREVHPFRDICQDWLEVIKSAYGYKNEVFGSYARRTRNFFNGDFRTEAMNDSGGEPSAVSLSNGIFSEGGGRQFKLKLNQCFESVALYQPMLIGQSPEVLVDADIPPVPSPAFLGIDPFDQQAMEQYQVFRLQKQWERDSSVDLSNMLKYWGDWVQKENGRIDHARRAVSQAIVEGMGGCYTEYYYPVASRVRYPRSRFISQERVVWDHDARHMEDITWMAILHVEPLNRVSEKFQIPYEILKRHASSATISSNVAKELYDYQISLSRNQPSHDLIYYFEVFSKNGIGHWLSRGNRLLRGQVSTYDMVGRNVRMIVCPGCPFPLNAPSQAIENETDEMILSRFQWETPYWKDENNMGGWPYSPLYYYEQIGQTYPMSIARTVLPEMDFINFVINRLAQRIDASCDSIIAVAKSLVNDFKKQLNKQMGPHKMLEVGTEESEKRVSDLIQFLEQRPVGTDIWLMLEKTVDRINRGMGTLDLLYGQSPSSFRSAEEASLKGAQVSVRRDDMSKITDMYLSNLSKKEFLCMYWNSSKDDLAPVLGEEVAQAMERLLLAQDIDSVVREFRFDIKSGSARIHNMASKQRSLSEIAGMYLPAAQELLMQGISAPWDAYMRDFAETVGLDPEKFLLSDSIQKWMAMRQEQQQQQQQHEAAMQQMQSTAESAGQTEDSRRQEQRHLQGLLFNQERHEQRMSQSEEAFGLRMRVRDKQKESAKS